jgi:succinylglutamic semialdehyde dehydrogenase
MDKLFINGNWQIGKGKLLTSQNPATGVTIWQGHASTAGQVVMAVAAARTALYAWHKLQINQRIVYLEKFVDLIANNKTELCKLLSHDTGKPLWEAKTEIAAMVNKLPISIQAYKDRCPDTSNTANNIISHLQHKPHGVCAIFGAFNFPASLPNGHIIPALLAGNTLVFKPSELTPLISAHIMQYWVQSGIPAGVINMLHGGADVGNMLVSSSDLDGLFFTGSFKTGMQIQKNSLKYPKRVLALEMGGNNPLVVHKIKNLPAAVYTIIQSAFITAGQRCTCARRLIIVKDQNTDHLLSLLAQATVNIRVGDPFAVPEPFMGTLISTTAADNILQEYTNLVAQGAGIIVPMRRGQHAILSPGILDTTRMSQIKDQEIFGPLLQVNLVDDFSTAIRFANNTDYGLSAGLLSDDAQCFAEFLLQSRAGIVNWNRPLTGSSSGLPFGGIGKSGNYRPSAYYAADYCSYPVASMREEILQLPEQLLPGIKL